MADYPYMLSNNKIVPIFDKIKTAATPERFTQEWLKQLGFSSSNDRAFIPMIKKLGFITDDGVPTAYYSKLRDERTAKAILAERIRELYADIFSVDVTANTASDATVKGIFSRVTGKDEKSVNRLQATFKSLCSCADFNGLPIHLDQVEAPPEHTVGNIPQKPNDAKPSTAPSFHYNIQIHLPATTEISVYNAIFKSLKENLLM